MLGARISFSAARISWRIFYMGRFVIDFGDIGMTPEQSDDLSGQLQKTALGFLADIKVSDPAMFKIPKDWRGLIAHLNIDALLESEKVLNRTMFDAKSLR
jgi:hypothetical protein